MITDIPTPNDFKISGKTFLNLAWDAAIYLALTLAEAEVEDWDEDGAVTDEYWRRAQHPLATAIALTQQGTEFLLKARIAETSPFLLLAGSPREWPKGCDRDDIGFSSFRTIDAQDLVRVHDTVTVVRLSENFRQSLKRMRVLRNVVFHSVDKQQRFAAKDVLVAVLESSGSLIPQDTWVSIRRSYLDATAESHIFDTGDTSSTNKTVVARELSMAIQLLSPAECSRLLGIDKRRRRYYCLGCVDRDLGLESHPKTAELRSTTPQSPSVYCYVCEVARPVRRKRCGSCPGNVIDEAEKVCLTCGLDTEFG